MFSIYSLFFFSYLHSLFWMLFTNIIRELWHSCSEGNPPRRQGTLNILDSM
uniref:Uncharacterized protein n=1 Tax=Octopus bimaculoides TaxID=37653 RepID=A0A0L8GQJ5_OCTBM